RVVAHRTVHHIPNGTDPLAHTTRAAVTPCLPSVALGDDEFVMFACGRLDRTKGLHHLLAAYRGISTSLPLLVLADFSHDANYSTSIRRAGTLDGRVHFHSDLLDKRSLYEVMRRSAVF